MTIVQVELGPRSYPIFIGSGLLADRSMLASQIESRQIMIVSNTTVAPLYIGLVEEALEGRSVHSVILPDGEEFKTLESFEKIISALLEQHFDRSCTLLALGGGVIGDLAGYAAASYQRGVKFVQIPTTLLAQVDSSVGGKTAVNHPLGKNMIGSFHQPTCVIADLATLNTLPQRELRAGLAEIIKYGLIDDPEFFVWLEKHLEDLLLLDKDCLEHAIRQSCQNKANIVATDELESGIRALLNLGHTFGHGLENVLGYGRWLHGEAVACGMSMAADLSTRMGLMHEGDYARVVSLISRAGLPIAPPENVDPMSLENAMKIDKKNRGGRIRLVLLRSIGDAFLCDDYPTTDFRNVLRNSKGAVTN
ncbi:MAG: 3-dehydroquinate synthase [Proteobacteria bacterium]|nr:3-dehydroquinate synthase [Pseudomonadota bacterium]